MTDLTGIPLAWTLAGANHSDHREILPTVREEFPKVGGLPGAPKERFKIAIANAGYDSAPTQDALEAIAIRSLIRKWRAQHGSKLGKVRWVVERSIGWLKGFRRLRCL